uniref:YtkA-like domain-containing protein n=1 Tax=Caulobacter sp. (strain K31) TaxID=366602 RepID=B0SXI5_CAUSK
MPRSASVTRRFFACRAVGGAALLAAVLMGGSVSAKPKDLNLSLDRPSDQGVFRVRVQSQVAPIPLSRVHPWTVHLTDQAGLPVSGAVIAIDGGMPEHHHGLPTAPRAASAATPGDYLISGMKFSMTGWWMLKLSIKAPDGRTDRITFNLVL